MQQLPTLLNVHRPVRQLFEEGAPVDTAPLSVDVALYGVAAARIYGLITVDGTLAIEVLRAVQRPGSPVYATKPVADVSVTNGTEFVVTVPLAGERGLRLTFTGDGPGTVTYLDVTAAPGVLPS